MSADYPIKYVKDVKPAIDHFLSGISNLMVSISEPWFPYPKYDKWNDPIDGFGSAGIYLFSKPNNVFNISFEENDSEIWYIGKTEENKKSIRGRVWSHLEPMTGELRSVLYEGETLKSQFIAKEWDSRANVSQAISPTTLLNFL
jgi:hypothetical protein